MSDSPGNPYDNSIDRSATLSVDLRLATRPYLSFWQRYTLEQDHDFLLKGDVFTADVIHYWIKYKRENEVDAIRVRPHPYEFCMYLDI